MVLAVDIMHGCGPSNKMYPLAVTAKERISSMSLMYQQKALYTLYITNKTEHFSFKSGYVERVVKHLKKDWFIVLL